MKIRPDILHFHDYAGCRVLLPGFKRNFRKLITVHELKIPCQHLDLYDRIISISESVQSDIRIRCGKESNIVFNGIDFSNITRKHLPIIPRNFYRLVQVGRLTHEVKGQHLLIEALAILRKQFNLAVTVTFIGDGPSKDHLISLARFLGVEDYCIFEGLQPRSWIFRHLAEFDVLVHPSLDEGFGLTIVEGIAAGLPVVTSDEGGPAEIVKNGRYGWEFRTGDSKSLARCIYSLLEKTNRAEIDRIIENAYKYTKKNFDISITVAKYKREYDSLAPKRMKLNTSEKKLQ